MTLLFSCYLSSFFFFFVINRPRGPSECHIRNKNQEFPKWWEVSNSFGYSTRDLSKGPDVQKCQEHSLWRFSVSKHFDLKYRFRATFSNKWSWTVSFLIRHWKRPVECINTLSPLRKETYKLYENWNRIKLLSHSYYDLTHISFQSLSVSYQVSFVPRLLFLNLLSNLVV